jgi:predicted transposase YbfD/YdcC
LTTRIEVGCKTNEIPHFAPLLAPLELRATVISADGLHTQTSNAIFLRQGKDAHFVFQVLGNQPNLFAQLDRLDWAAVPVAEHTEQRDRGRHEVRTIRVLDAPEEVLFPHVAQVFLIERKTTQRGQTSYESVLYVTSLSAAQASPADLLAYVRAHDH